MKRWPALLVLMLASGLIAAGCGQSEEDQAKDDVCDARADIKKQVDDLSSLTLGTATANRVKGDLSAIADDLKKIEAAQGDLDDQRKQQVESANKAFTSEVDAIAQDLGENLSLSGAKAKLQSAIQQLASSYNQTFAQVDCD